MKYKLKVNGYSTDGHFADAEGLKAYLIKWKWASDEQFNISDDEDEEGKDVSVEELVQTLLKGDNVVCWTPCMCEMGDDYVELLLIIK